jgi:hypothetical protein
MVRFLLCGEPLAGMIFWDASSDFPQKLPELETLY